MNDKITIFDFDDTYDLQDFYKNSQFKRVDLTNIHGVFGYCDNETLKRLKNIILKEDTSGINFLGSGNYHYMTYLLMQKVDKPFTLVLFDHHTDMMNSLFGNLMSCGCWVKRALDENKMLKKVIIIGVEKKLIDNIDEKYRNRVFCYSEEDIKHNILWTSFLKDKIDKPIYISIDKDVIGKDEAKTNWQQGILTLEELREIFDFLVDNGEVISVDVCGECSSRDEIVANFYSDSIINSEANKEIIEMVEEESIVN